MRFVPPPSAAGVVHDGGGDTEDMTVGRMPDFVVIGAYKSGTTSLVDYLGRHEQVFMPWLQEPNYWAYEQDLPHGGPRPEVDSHSIYRRHRARTRTQYESLFADAPPGTITGECSPEYMRSPYACRRIREALPDVKLLAIVRNPVERAHSDYQAFVRDSLERESFAAAVRRPYGTDPGNQYVATGFYGAQLQPYFDTFGSQNIKVMLTEDLQRDQAGTMHDVFAFLGVDPARWEPDTDLQRNVSGRPRNPVVATAYRLRRRLRPVLKPIVPPGLQRRADKILAAGLEREKVDPVVRKELEEVYRDDVALLEKLIGRDLSAWFSA